MSEPDFTFLICSERSGSNFLTGLMNGHSTISAPPPTHMFRLFATNAANYGDLERDENWEILLADMVAAFDNQLGVWNTRPTVEFLRRHAAWRDVAAVLRAIYRTEARHDGAKHVFVKENHTARFAAFLLANFQPCRFVFMVRDPRDVAASYQSTDGIPGGVIRAVDVWRGDQEENVRLLSELSGTGHIHCLSYENLIAQSVGELTSLTRFLGLGFELGMLNFHQDDRLRRNADRITAWGNLAKPILTGNAGKFANRLTDAEIEYVELCCFELMETFNYPTQIVSARPTDRHRSRRIKELIPQLREGHYAVETSDEQEKRQRRLAVIETVISRKLD